MEWDQRTVAGGFNRATVQRSHMWALAWAVMRQQKSGRRLNGRPTSARTVAQVRAIGNVQKD
jgi:hypothetical protein